MSTQQSVRVVWIELQCSLERSLCRSPTKLICLDQTQRRVCLGQLRVEAQCRFHCLPRTNPSDVGETQMVRVAEHVVRIGQSGVRKCELRIERNGLLEQLNRFGDRLEVAFVPVKVNRGCGVGSSVAWSRLGTVTRPDWNRRARPEGKLSLRLIGQICLVRFARDFKLKLRPRGLRFTS